MSYAADSVNLFPTVLELLEAGAPAGGLGVLYTRLHVGTILCQEVRSSAHTYFGDCRLLGFLLVGRLGS